MSQLIQLSERREPTVETTVIAKGTGVKHKNVIALVREYAEDFRKYGDLAFHTERFMTRGGTQRREVATLNEDQALLLMAYMRNSPMARQFKIRLVQAFVDCRTDPAKTKCTADSAPAQPGVTVPKTLPEALRLAADLAEKSIEGQSKAAQLESKVAEQKAELDALRMMVSSKDHFSITNAAKLLKFPPRELIRFMRQIGWIYKRDDVPTQEQVDRGNLHLCMTKLYRNSGSSFFKPQTHVTVRGCVALYKRLLKDGRIEKQERLFDQKDLDAVPAAQRE